MWDAIYVGLEPQPWPYNITRARHYINFLKIHPHLHKSNIHPPLHKRYSVRVDSYPHPQHIKVLKHFVYIWYGCGMQSEAVCRLNHDTTTPFALNHTQTSKIQPHLHNYNSVRVYPNVHPQHIKVLNHFVYICYGCGMPSEAVCSLNHETTTTFCLTQTPAFRNFTPTCTGITG